MATVSVKALSGEQVEVLAMAMRTILKQPEKNALRGPDEKGWACHYFGKEGHLKQDCLQASKPPQLHVPSAKDHIERLPPEA